MSDPGQPMSLRAQAKHVVNHYQLTGKPLEFGGPRISSSNRA